MNELHLLRRLRSEVPEPAPDRLATQERRLLAALGTPDPARTRHGWRSRIAIPVAVAAALAVAVAAVGVGTHRTDGRHRAAPVPPATTPGTPGTSGTSAEPSRMVPMSAVEVLNRAATAAENAELTVRPDQFIYRELRQTSGFVIATGNSPADHIRWNVPEIEQSWLSVDGTRIGLARVRDLPPEPYPGRALPSPLPSFPGALTAAGDTTVCRTGDAPHPPFIIGDHLGWQDPHGTYQYLTTLPTDPAQMRRYLYQHPPHVEGDGNDIPADELAWVAAALMLEQFAMPGRQSAALFRALALIPGASVVGEVTDPAGRKGIAVAFTQLVDASGGLRQELVFDPTTYRFLASQRVAVDAARARMPVGSVQYAIAQLDLGVADTPPPGADPRRCR